MLSQFFILSLRGDTLAFRDYRGDVVAGTPEIFHRRIKAFRASTNHPPPIFHVEGTQFLHIVQQGLYFVCTTTMNVPPVFVLELLNKVAMICKDYCGVLSEEAIRYNFALIYEILDEVLDYGYPQCTSTDQLKNYIFNDPQPIMSSSGISLKQISTMSMFGADKRAAPSSAPNKSVMDEKNEVYIDVMERLTVLVANTGQTVKSELDGCIKIRSFLAGTPEIRLELNEDLQIRNWENQMGVSTNREFSSTVLDECCLHECINQIEFEKNRALLFNPPVGEWTAMQYNVFNAPVLPFQIHPYVEQPNEETLTLRLKVRCDVARQYHAVGITATIPLPKATIALNFNASTGANSIEHSKKNSSVQWVIKRMSGGTEQSAEFHIKLPEVTNLSKKELGPVSLVFEFPLFVGSNLKVRSLKVIEKNSMYTPMRWVRYITHTDSYVVRI